MEFELLGIQIDEASTSGQGLLNTLFAIDTALAGLSSQDALDRIRRITNEQGRTLEQLVGTGRLRQAYETARNETAQLTQGDERRILAIGERFGRAVGAFWSRTRQFIADNSGDINRIIDRAQQELIPLYETITNYLTQQIDRLERRLPGIIQSIQNAWPAIVATIDQVVLRLQQAASIFTSLGLSGPQVVEPRRLFGRCDCLQRHRHPAD